MAVERKFERDIDVMLAEEFIVSPSFAERVLELTRFADSHARVIDTFVSVTDGSGESDLVVLLERDDHSRIAIHIENKIDAILQAAQGERYHRRAKSAVADGSYVDYTVLLCAPRAYLAGMADDPAFENCISYETIADLILASGNDDRSFYRADFLMKAASRSANRWKPRYDDATDAFWKAAGAIAVKEFPALQFDTRKRFASNCDWVSVSTSDMKGRPKRFRIDIKGSDGYVDLNVSSTDITKFHPLVEPLLDADMTPEDASNSCVIRLRVKPFRVSDGIAPGMPKVREAFAAALRLACFFKERRQQLVEIAKSSEWTRAA